MFFQTLRGQLFAKADVHCARVTSAFDPDMGASKQEMY